MDKFEQSITDMLKLSLKERMQEIAEEKEICICPTCPVTADLGLIHDEFCLKGSEAARRWTKWLISKK